jgi:hypothetical protein
MFARATTTAVLVAASLLSGCVIVPTSAAALGKASLDRVVVAIALPKGTDLKTYRGGSPWSRARLTVSRLDGGGSDLVQPLEGVKGGLRAKAPLRDLDPKAPYRMDIELIYEEPSGIERVVARGAMGTDEAEPVMLKAGSNTLQIPVAPTVKGDKIALEPLVIKKKTSTDKDDEDESDSPFKLGFGGDTTDDDDDMTAEGKLIATVIGVIGSVLLQSAVDSVVEADKAPAKRTVK